MTNRELVEAFFDAQRRGDLDAVAAMLDDEMVMDWPQSGERFRGRANVLGAMQAQRVPPQFAGEPRIIGDGDIWVYMVPLRYGDDLRHYVAVVEVADGRVRHGIGHWAAPFEPDPVRAAFTDQISAQPTQR
jgi:ketosteroid isomerase-like protein